MAGRRLSKSRCSNAVLSRVDRRYKGRSLNPSVPRAIEALSGRSFFGVWFRLRHGLIPRWLFRVRGRRS